jgi:hypothetical protein
MLHLPMVAFKMVDDRPGDLVRSAIGASCDHPEALS